jgi:hypothetical protein
MSSRSPAIAARTRRALPAALLGIAWGAGHTLTLWLVGAAIIVFDLVVPPRVGLALEFAVALALVVVGLLNLNHPAHAHSELEDSPERPLARRAFLVGLVHGLAGSAAVALLVLATVHDTVLACGYLGVFALGTLVGMAVVTTGLHPADGRRCVAPHAVPARDPLGDWHALARFRPVARLADRLGGRPVHRGPALDAALNPSRIPG